MPPAHALALMMMLIIIRLMAKNLFIFVMFKSCYVRIIQIKKNHLAVGIGAQFVDSATHLHHLVEGSKATNDGVARHHRYLAIEMLKADVDILRGCENFLNTTS